MVFIGIDSNHIFQIQSSANFAMHLQFRNGDDDIGFEYLSSDTILVATPMCADGLLAVIISAVELSAINMPHQAVLAEVHLHGSPLTRTQGLSCPDNAIPKRRFFSAKIPQPEAHP